MEARRELRITTVMALATARVSTGKASFSAAGCADAEWFCVAAGVEACGGWVELVVVVAGGWAGGEFDGVFGDVAGAWGAAVHEVAGYVGAAGAGFGDGAAG